MRVQQMRGGVQLAGDGVALASGRFSRIQPRMPSRTF